MDKQKQIEEIHKMAQIALGKQVTMECTKFAIEEGFFDNFIALYNAGYRKIDKGSVVQILKRVEFMGKEYDIQEVSMARSTYDVVLEQARKQAVKEVLEMIKNKGTIHTEYDWNDYLSIDIDYLKEIAKEFGVEL